MNILLISECSGNAVKETRRILDQFSERRGVRTWQTAITQAGLDTLRRLLRKTARKNTAIACYWIRGIDRSELLWIVGAADRFNAQGAVPTNTTARNILRTKDENDWHTLRIIHLLTALAALWHDLGKACAQFQQILRQVGRTEGNLLRHEWISLRIFQAFVGQDDDQAWLNRLSRQDIAATDCLKSLQADGGGAVSSEPFRSLPDLAQAVGWLIVTHHRLPVRPREGESAFRADMLEKIPSSIAAGWNEERFGTSSSKELETYWQFKHGLPVDLPAWQERAAKYARQLLAFQPDQLAQALKNPYVMHLARLALTLADHEFSSLDLSRERQVKPAANQLFANTAHGQLNQYLDEHLLGVEKLCGEIVHALPKLAEELPRLSRHKGLRQRAILERFRWQNKAVEEAEGIRGRSTAQGGFIVNMASTGCGKTLGNARICYALADPGQGMRCAFALGLRTLTLQTGREYRERLGLSDDEVAILVGGAAYRELSEHYAQESAGAESAQSLLPEDGHVVFAGNADAHPVLRRVLKDAGARSLLAAPLLACTIDHLVPATEGIRGGRQIVPMLRLLSGDLVLDELDDYDIDDLPAVARLVYWAGMLGARVLISSATLPPALVQGMFEAYREGRRVFQRNRGLRPGEELDICCLWVDEFDAVAHDCADVAAFAQAHADFAGKRASLVSKAPALRRAALLPVDIKSKVPVPGTITSKERAEIRAAYARIILDGCLCLHQRHAAADPVSGTRVSFGLVRMANIGPLRDVAQVLYGLALPAHIRPLRIHLCVYHSQFPLLMRSAIEQRLDKVLNRKQPEAVFELPEIRHLLDAEPQMEHLFMVLGSPVTEVGRDHDYDWAVVEPSSMRSLIQLAGRIRRHRPEPCDAINILILSRNIRSLEKPGEPAFVQPGFEASSGKYKLYRHDLEHLLRPEQYEIITACPRILAAEELRPSENLADLEHARLSRLMQGEPVRKLSARELRAGDKAVPPLGAYSWWRQPESMLCGILQKEQPFREHRPEVDFVLLPDEDQEEWILHELPKERGQDPVAKESLLTRSRLDCSGAIRPWGRVEYMEALAELAEQLDMDMQDCARKFGTITLPKNDNGWSFDPVLGFGVEK
ncbi:MAG: type I-F CRISPR-associated helicase Cas3f [Desulfobulbus sp.]|jgi:CRISPR-associated endonuclease/helicase Cas3|uniref:type I-F CRISPR-associated helicase Cas3f n=1 Tax=Desulfobulbus sp. TaxID=895 RepID=UPI002843FBBA|nr:type I-F CRISPR-associated helicase Cas3f [Desulfobulbus sp.]MDR2549040.1 type I-F CRISPR-associated helicase Cas3f [Desulfobulbus sp.]